MTSILWNQNLENSIFRIYNNLPTKPMNIIEVGCFEGFGTLKLNKLLCQNNLSKITCVDPFDDVYVKGNTEFSDIDPIFVGQYDKFITNTLEIKDSIIIKKGYSDDILSSLPSKEYDFIYIDGDHSENAVYKDGVNAIRLIKNGGIILFDDYYWVHKSQVTKNGIEKFIQEFNNEIEVLFRGPVQCAILVK
jgi:predicted O-methyltransferase YrrM